MKKATRIYFSLFTQMLCQIINYRKKQAIKIAYVLMWYNFKKRGF